MLALGIGRYFALQTETRLNALKDKHGVHIFYMPAPQAPPSLLH